MLCILVTRPTYSAAQEGKVIHGWEWNILSERILRAGLLTDRVTLISMEDDYGRRMTPEELTRLLNQLPLQMIVPLDEGSLEAVTGRRSIRKWNLSPLDTLPELTCRRAVPTFHPAQTRKEPELTLYIERALNRAVTHMSTEPWSLPETHFHLNPCYDETISVLESLRDKPWLSIDIETGRHQINTFGFAWSPTEAIAVKVLPEALPNPSVHHTVWGLIRELCEGPAAKIMQNGLYERMYCSRYGFHINNFRHDTMLAMKLLWPELPRGLDNVGRFYTLRPYWKDEGKNLEGEGNRKDWGDIRDWEKHFLYNAKDCAFTMEAALEQRKDLTERGLLPLYESYITRLFNPVFEMCSRGLPINQVTRQRLETEQSEKVKELISELSEPINPGSPKQKISFLTGKGMRLPQKRNKQTGKLTPSTDELSLKKLRLKHPDDHDLKVLLQVAKINKALSSYYRVKTFPDDRIRFSLDAFSTETGRMSCRKDPWDGGFNAQTMGKSTKQMIEWPEDSGRVFLEIDLRQAESRFVAYDACEETLLGMLERGEDIHRYVAAEIYNKPMDQIIHAERQLGKKSGHGANYSMGVMTFMDSCLKEMDLVLTKSEASRALEAYHRVFPGIRRWHQRIRQEVYNKRMLDNPLGLIRYFYGRMDDNTYREAYAYRPQSTIPMITNHLMLGLAELRETGKAQFHFHLQVHDSVYISCLHDQVERIAEFAYDTNRWHPEVILPAGRLVIPAEVQQGTNLAKMEVIHV